MLDPTTGALSPTRLSRRAALGLGSLAALGATSACRVQTTSDPGLAGGNPADVGKIKFPEPKGTLPTEAVSYRAMITGGIKAPYFQAVWKAFHNAHNKITMQLDATDADRIDEVIPLSVRNKTAPDLFQMPSTVPVQVAVNNGWVAPLDEVVPDFSSWRDSFPKTAFIPGVHVFGGKTYSWTFTSSKSQYGNLMFFDKVLLDKADLDPSADRFTVDDLRTAAKKISKSGGGKSYGIAIGGTSLGSVATGLAVLSGMAGDTMDFRTGEYNYTRPELLAAVELLLAMKADGSFLPGSVSLTQDEVDARFPQGNVGITFDGAWNVSNWKTSNPGYSYGIAAPPTGTDKVDHKVGYVEGTALPLFAYAGSKLKTVTGELLRYMGSVDGQTAMVTLTGGLFNSELPAADEAAKQSKLLSGQAKQARSIAADLLVTQPLPQVGNPDVSEAILQLKPVQPTFSDIVEGAFTGQIGNLKKALSNLQDDSDKALDEAIAAANKKGADVSRDDWVFSNWNPGQDYTAADYQAR